MARSALQISDLKGLIEQADKIALSAKGVVLYTVREVRKEIAALVDELNVGGSADARERVIEAAQKKMRLLERRLNRLQEAQMLLAAKAGVAQASRDTGVSVRYSREHADAIIGVLRAKGAESFAATYTQSMTSSVTSALRKAVYDAFQENAVSGGTMVELRKTIQQKMSSALKDGDAFVFTDRSGRQWDAGRYFQMNVRTNTMRVYNDSMCDAITRGTGSDLVRVSDDGGTADSCDACQRWAGKILSITGKTRGFPTVDDARADGVFHPNCIHTLEPVDEDLDADEIARQRKGK